jgi:hypothetical protein
VRRVPSRQQIEAGTSRQALHLAQVLDQARPKRGSTGCRKELGVLECLLGKSKNLCFVCSCFDNPSRRCFTFVHLVAASILSRQNVDSRQFARSRELFFTIKMR